MKPIISMHTVFALMTAATMSTAFAAEVAPAPMAPAASMPALQQRMKSIRAETDPARRMALMEDQMRAMESMMREMPDGCPMAGGASGGKGSDMMRDHMQMMEKRMDMMQQMMEMHMKSEPMKPMK